MEPLTDEQKRAVLKEAFDFSGFVVVDSSFLINLANSFSGSYGSYDVDGTLNEQIDFFERFLQKIPENAFYTDEFLQERVEGVKGLVDLAERISNVSATHGRFLNLTNRSSPIVGTKDDVLNRAKNYYHLACLERAFLTDLIDRSFSPFVEHYLSEAEVYLDPITAAVLDVSKRKGVSRRFVNPVTGRASSHKFDENDARIFAKAFCLAGVGDARVLTSDGDFSRIYKTFFQDYRVLSESHGFSQRDGFKQNYRFEIAKFLPMGIDYIKMLSENHTPQKSFMDF